MLAAHADLHVHSKYSDRPSEWLLRRIGTAECYTEPMAVFERCRARGMHFVTISDHNRIDGALAIAHLPGTFVSCEVTTYFPEDGAKLHLLVWGISEAQFATIDRIRTNVYELRQYLIEQDIAHAIAHPFFRVNATLGPDHVEKLLVLFNRFEGINGTRDPRAADLVQAIFTQITPEMIAKMADKHGIEPVGPTPWIKKFTGGSDDHGGVYIASAYTTTPPAATVEEFLDHLRRGDHQMDGRSGTSLRLAHSFYHIAWEYYRQRILNNADGRGSFIGELFSRMLEQTNPANLTFRQKARFWLGRVWPSRRKNLSPTEQVIFDEFRNLLRNRDASPSPNGDNAVTAEQTFQIACDITHQLGYTFARKLADHLRDGDLMGSLQSIAAMAPMAMSISPYLAAMATQHKDESFLQAVAQRFDAGQHLFMRSNRLAWVTDTFADVNGVARTIQSIAAVARQRQQPLTVVTSLSRQPQVDVDLQNFAPVGEFKMPGYEEQTLAVPPFLQVIEYLERQRFSQVIISTPGPMGLTALAAAKLMGLRAIGVYHTDFPKYVRCLTEDVALEEMTWRYMLWFYGQMDVILAPSETYREQLIEVGLDPARISILRRGVDAQRFHPAHRDENYWSRAGLGEDFTFIYVGRMSDEKNLRRLLVDFQNLLSTGVRAQLAMVGDGPILAELRRQRHPRVHFTGALHGLELARAYASADAFVFPSTTDTFGNVVLEAHASALPTIVTNQGGPKELVRHGVDGLVVNLDRPTALVEAMSFLASDSPAAHGMGQAARSAAEQSDWSAVLDQLLASCPVTAPANDLSPVEPARTRRGHLPVPQEDPAWNIA